VITPLSPVQWRLTDGPDGPSLRPSIGNWSLPCRSHYWISRGRVKWAGDLSDDKIREGRVANALLREVYFDAINAPPDLAYDAMSPPTRKQGWIARVITWVKRQLLR